MSTPGTRLQATVDSSGRTVTFAALFAAPLEDDLGEAACGEARLATGDGQELGLGCLCPPSAVTWREQRRIELCTHTYRGAGPFTAELSVDDQVVASAVVDLARPESGARAVEPSPVPLFALAPVHDAPHQRRLKVQAPALSNGKRLRLDAGGGQVREFAGEDGQAASAEVLLTYPKPGAYLVTLDLLDAEGFWIETLAQSPLEIAAEEGPKEAVEPRALPPWAATEPLATRRVVDWLPYRNIRPVAGGTRTYSQPGGGTVRRWVGSGTWMSVRRETTVGGALWYQTAGGDWIKASTVSFFVPSELQGCCSTMPRRPAPTATSAAALLRRAPWRRHIDGAERAHATGCEPGNPPVDVLHAAQVTILEELRVGSEAWYRIAEARWMLRHLRPPRLLHPSPRRNGPHRCRHCVSAQCPRPARHRGHESAGRVAARAMW